MNIFEHFDQAQEAINKVNESGIQGITQMAKKYKKATGYFHMDLDGVTSAIAMKAYLESYGIKTTKLVPINYGDKEFSAAKADKGSLKWMVDFAHSKPFLNIHTDHHDSQSGVSKGTATAFTEAPANVTAISAKISPRDLFPQEDLKLIAMVDSADYARNGVTPDQVMNSAFEVDTSVDVAGNRQMMGLVVNKLLLANKNKKDFLTDLVDQANPSLISMYNIIIKLSKKAGFRPPATVGVGTKNYQEQQKNALQKPMVDPMKLKSGQATRWNDTIVQYGGGFMGGANVYDRYTPFKLNPDAHFYIIGWPMGLVQLSKNPFVSLKNPYHFGDLALKKVLSGSKWKGKLSKIKVTLRDMKYIFEKDIKPKDREALGFSWDDLVALFDDKQVKGVSFSSEGGWTNFLRSITNVKFNQLSKKQLAMMEKVSISLYDLMMAQSGGHKDITNVSGWNFAGKDYVDNLMKPFMKDLANEMKDKSLEG
jgi:hypothetical protein